MLRPIILLVALTLPFSARAESIDLIIGDRPATEIRRIIPSETPANLRLPELTYVADFEVLGQPDALTADQTATLAKLIADPAAFDADGEATCKFRPGVALRFGTAPDAIDLLVCFACDEVAAVPSGQGIEQLALMPQSSRDVLLNLSKEALPNDEAIQELPAVRREGPAPAPPAPPSE